MTRTAYVTEYGNWGTENFIMFPADQLTDEQWQTLDDLPDTQKLRYVIAVLNGDDLTRYEEN